VSDTTEVLQALRRRRQARQKVLAHLEARLAQQPQDAHLLFLHEEHSRALAQIDADLRRYDQSGQVRAGQLAELVDHYLEQWQAAPPVVTTLEQSLRHELQTWQEMLARVEERLLRLPGDPRLMQLRSEHQWRIVRLQEQLESGSQRLPAPIEPESLPDTLNPLQRELETWRALQQKTQARLQARPELTHLKGVLAEHQAKIEALEQRLAASEEHPARQVKLDRGGHDPESVAGG
jgi:chromosome segregation ATPase